ncbi:MAG: hypothetical protein ACR2J8_09140, partial [Thermomicrobiales bacterium]
TARILRPVPAGRVNRACPRIAREVHEMQMPAFRLRGGALSLTTRRCSRRAAIAATGATLLPRGPIRPGALAAQPTLTGDCTQDPGVDLLGRFDLGEPVLPIEALLTPMGWPLYANYQTGLSFYYPPDWSASTIWAEGLSASGAPVWTASQPFVPALTSHRIVSPDGAAAFEAVIGTLYGSILSPLQAAGIAELGLAGEGTPLSEVCAFEDLNPLQPGWLRAVWAGANQQVTLVSQGYALASPSSFTPNTIVTWYAMAGPRGLFEALMREIYLRILFQFLPGGGDEPTPTPEGW